MALMQPCIVISQGTVNCLRLQQIQWVVGIVNYFSLTFCKMAAIIRFERTLPHYVKKRQR